MLVSRLSQPCFIVAAVLGMALALIPQVNATDNFDSLHAAIEAANSKDGNSIIELAEGITLSAALPPITGDIRVEGNGYSISGADSFRIFDVDGGRLSLVKLTLTAARAEDQGGAIRLRNGAEVVIENTTLSENSATNGGAIATSSHADRLTVSGSSFLNNKADKNAAAIYADGGTIEISNGVFARNCAEIAENIVSEDLDRAREDRYVDGDGCLQITYHWTDPGEINVNIEGYGGAIRLLNRAQASVETSSFSTNKATKGGAIAIEGPGATLTVSSSSFDGNFAKHNGGAVHAGGGATEIRRSSFLDNYSDTSGGALFGEAGELNIANSSFHNNRASSWGGVLTASGADATMTHATMVNNAAAHSGGDAIQTVEGNVKLFNSIIVNGGASDDCAGGLDQMAGNLSTDGTCALLASDDPLLDQLTGSPAWYPLKDFSPAVDAADPDYCLDIDQVGTARPQGSGCDVGAFESTTALPKPRPIEPPPCPLALQIIAANTDAPAGGCPAGEGHDVITLDENITLNRLLPRITSDITIEGNGHTISGDNRFRIFNVTDGTLTLNNVSLTKGKVPPNAKGGAVLVESVGQLVVNDSTFRESMAKEGGAIFITNPSSRLTINNSRFIDNRAIAFGAGGAIVMEDGKVVINSSSFIKNRSDNIGGAIGTWGSGEFSVTNSTFSGNSAKSGGAVYSGGASLSLTHVTLVDNYADEGGAIAIFESYPSRVRARNSIIFDQRDRISLCQGMALAESRGNLIGDSTCDGRAGGDPLLGELTGSPGYHSPEAGSPAIDAADPAYCARTDQLGSSRPQGARCDIGAIEFRAN